MTKKKDQIILPHGVKTIGLSESEVAALWGISPGQLEKVDPSHKPRARRVGRRKLFSQMEAVAKFHELPFWDEEASSEDEWSVS